MSRTPPDALLQELAAREAIRDLACRYAHHVWQKQVAAAVELFTEDGEMDTGEPPVLRGHAALLETYERMLGAGHFRIRSNIFAVAGYSGRFTAIKGIQAVRVIMSKKVSIAHVLAMGYSHLPKVFIPC